MFEIKQRRVRISRGYFSRRFRTWDGITTTLSHLHATRPHLRPVGFGPSLKTWPKWPEQALQVTSVRGRNGMELSCVSLTAPGNASKNDGLHDTVSDASPFPVCYHHLQTIAHQLSLASRGLHVSAWSPKGLRSPSGARVEFCRRAEHVAAAAPALEGALPVLLPRRYTATFSPTGSRTL